MASQKLASYACAHKTASHLTIPPFAFPLILCFGPDPWTFHPWPTGDCNPPPSLQESLAPSCPPRLLPCPPPKRIISAWTGEIFPWSLAEPNPNALGIELRHLSCPLSHLPDALCPFSVQLRLTHQLCRCSSSAIAVLAVVAFGAGLQSGLRKVDRRAALQLLSPSDTWTC